MTISKIALISALAAVIAAPALAQPPTPEERAARFEAADKNHDGKLDKAEFIASLPPAAQASADQIWSARVDTDGDGFVTREQFMALRMGPPRTQ